MDLTDPASPSSDRTFPEAEGNAGRAVSAVTHPSPESLSRLLVIALAAALVAGMTSLLVGEVILKAYQSDLFPRLKIRPTAEDMRRLSDAQRLSAALTFTVMGGLFGLAMGLAGGLARRSVAAGARAAILGFLLGTVAAAFPGALLLPMFFKRHDPQSGDLVLPLLTHGGIWSPVGPLAAWRSAWDSAVGDVGKQRWWEDLPARPRRRSFTNRRCSRLRVRTRRTCRCRRQSRHERWPNCSSRSSRRSGRSWRCVNHKLSSCRNSPPRRRRACQATRTSAY